MIFTIFSPAGKKNQSCTPFAEFADSHNSTMGAGFSERTTQTRGDSIRAYWARWRIEQRKRKATEAREALETEGQLPLVLEPGKGCDRDG